MSERQGREDTKDAVYIHVLTASTYARPKVQGSGV